MCWNDIDCRYCRVSLSYCRKTILSHWELRSLQDNNDVYEYLSGTPIIPTTSFLQLSQPDVLAEYRKVIHYMRLALAAYGWPAVVMMKTDANCCGILPKLRYSMLSNFNNENDMNVKKKNYIQGKYRCPFFPRRWTISRPDSIILHII